MLVATVYKVYGLLLYAEAGVTYRKDGVRQALIAGLASGTVLIAAAVMVLLEVRVGASVGLGVMLAMVGIFGSRYVRTRAFVTSGLMLAASILALAVLVRGLQ
jgi:uncharacterized membrane protein (UPF0136 family)